MSNDWQTLAQTWQSQAIDLPQLKRKTRWKTVRMWANGALELLVIVYVWGITFWMWDKLQDSMLWLSWLLLWCVVTPVCVFFSFRAKRGLWQVMDHSVVSLLVLRKKRAEWGIKSMRYSIVGIGVALALSILWVIASHFFAPLDASKPWYHFWIRVGFTAVWLVLAAGLCLWYQRHQQKKLQEVAQLLQEFAL